MSDLSTRLQLLLDEKGLSKNAFAKQVGVSQPAISDIILGKTRNPKNILEIATALGVDPMWLKTGEGEAYPQSDKQSAVENKEINLVQSEPDDEHTYRIDLLDVQAAAHSVGIINLDYPEVITSMFFSLDGLMQIVGRTNVEDIRLLIVPTDSMAPTINKGDLVFVDVSKKYYYGEGVYCFLLNGETYIKRMMRLPNGIYRALSDNKNYEPFDITPELCDTAEFVGKFIRVLPIQLRDL